MHRWNLVTVSVLTLASAVFADGLRPWVLASDGPADVATKVQEVRAALEGQGFQVAGAYSPKAGAEVLVVTSDELKAVAGKSEFGGYGAVVRVGVTLVNGSVQVAYTNPEYMRASYRMAGDLSGATTKLETALGRKAGFGSAKGLSEKELRGYHYMVLMPFFTDPVVLAKYDSQEAALAAVEKGLAAGDGGTARVYRVDVPGKKETVFGVAVKKGEGADAKIIDTIDTAAQRHTPHFPYELLVTDGTVRMLHGKFRLAQSWPDLTLGAFMKIGAAPDAIEAALSRAAGKK